MSGVLGNRLVVGANSVVLLWAPGALSLVLLVLVTALVATCRRRGPVLLAHRHRHAGGLHPVHDGRAESLLALPTIVLMWRAIRLPAGLVTADTLTCGTVMAHIAASDDGAVRRPGTTFETLVLLLLLITLTVAPLILMAAIGEAGVLAVRPWRECAPTS